jgi:hypothetical protein
MRFITFILAFLVLSLSCIPCADGVAAGMQGGTEIAQTGHQHPQHTDYCSPLCICACCGTVSFITVHATVECPVIPVPRNYVVFETSSVQDLPLPVWQPPQLS